MKDEARVPNAQKRKQDFQEREVAKMRRKDEKKGTRKLEEDQFEFTAPMQQNA